VTCHPEKAAEGVLRSILGYGRRNPCCWPDALRGVVQRPNSEAVRVRLFRREVMRIAIAGYGTIGHLVEDIFGLVHDTVIYDPPKGLGHPDCLQDVDFVFVCVPTHSLADGECDSTKVEEIVAAATPEQAIVCHSTVSIGTTERLMRTYGKPLVYVPEYAGESPDHPYRQIVNRAFFILGGYEPTVTSVRQLFETVYGDECRYYSVAPTAAEFAKYMENAFLALKVAFCNEFYDLCQVFRVDYELVRELWLQDPRIGASHTVVTSERGYDGKCLPKDVSALCATARRAGVLMEMMEAAQRANTRHRQQGAGLRSADA
jgi:UDPglucose 6-dehydrogenase